MSDSAKTEADSTVTVKDVQEQQNLAPNGKEASSNGLSQQLEEKIIRQVEYYFGDRNLPRDKFLQSAIAESEGGWVPISTLLTFNRLKALSSDSTYIVSTLRKSTANILEVNSDGTSVRRSPDNPPPDIFSPQQRQKMKEKTVYVKGFDEDAKFDDIQSFLDQYGKLEHVQMRKKLTDKTFKGSVFAEFKEKEKAESFLGLPTLQFKGKELIKESKDAYFRRKAEERKKEKELKKAAAKPEVVASQVRQKAAVLHFKGLTKPDTTREAIKEEMRAYATVAFIDFSKGDTEGYIRFEEENGASKAFEGVKAAAPEGGTTQLCGSNIEIRVLEGSEEEEYWVKAQEDRLRGKRGKKGRGGRQGNQADNRKRKQGSRKGEGPVTKQPKKEEEEGAGGEGSGQEAGEAKETSMEETAQE